MISAAWRASPLCNSARFSQAMLQSTLITFNPRAVPMKLSPTPPFPLGHNGGPPQDEHVPPWGSTPIKTFLIWRKATADPFRNLPRETIIRRVKKAQAIGLTYREYSIEILERGVFLQPTDTARIAEIKARRITPL